MRARYDWGGRVLAAVGTAAAGTGACSLALVPGHRPLQTLGVVATAIVVAAAVTGKRWLGTAAVLGAAATVAGAAVLGGDRVGVRHLLAASVLLTALVVGLDRVERSARPGTEVLWRAPVPALVAVPLLSLAAAGGVAASAVRSVRPSVTVALLGLAAALGALLVATRGTGWREPEAAGVRRPGKDVRKSLPDPPHDADRT